MELNLQKDNNLTFKAVEFIKTWKPGSDNNAKNPSEDALWRRDRVKDFLRTIGRESEAVKELMDCEVRINNRPKGLPSLDKVYRLLKQDYQKKTSAYGNTIKKFHLVVDIWNEINKLDGHIYASTLNYPKDHKHFEEGIETSAWKRVSGIGSDFWKKLDSHSKFHDYETYGKKCVNTHPLMLDDKTAVPKDCPFYCVFAYLGRTVNQRPLFSVLQIYGTSGDFLDDMKKLPKGWIPIYVNIPVVKRDTRPDNEAK